MAAQRFLFFVCAACLAACGEASERPRDPLPTIEEAEPPYGAEGTLVEISGRDLDAPSLAAVFNGVATKPVEQSPSRAVFQIPRGARTGALFLRTSGGTSAPFAFEIAQPNFTAWRSVSAGSRHACGIQSSGVLLCWGDNRAQQLGFPEDTPSGFPRALDVSTRWLSVYGGLYLDRGNTCGIAKNGGLWCWGDNTAAQFGDGTKTSSGEPVKAGGRITTWNQITLGAYHACGLSGAKLYCWGTTNYSYSGGGDYALNPLAVAPPAGQTGWSYVAAGSLHTCAIAQPSEALYCWGSNSAGQLGSAVTQDSATPVPVQSSLRWRVVAGSSYTSVGATCGVASGGELFCWGSNNSHQVGGDAEEVSTPTQLPGQWKTVTLGRSHACAINAAGELYCWGANRFGQTGSLNIIKPTRAPAKVNDDTDWESVSAGAEHTCAVKKSGDLYCWGNNEDGQLGRYSFNRYDPRPQMVRYSFP